MPAIAETLVINEISDEQKILRYCQFCREYEEKSEFYYEIHHFSKYRNTLSESGELDDGPHYTEVQIKSLIEQAAIPVTQFFEMESNLLISALAENEYRTTNPKDGDGFWCGGLQWRHPLARELGTEIDFTYQEM